MKSLDSIGIKHNTDKASIGRLEPNGIRAGGHNYLPVYSSFIQGLIKEITLINGAEIILLELGVGPVWNAGASVNMFREYMPKRTRIITIDKNKNALERVSDKSIETIEMDLSNTSLLKSFCESKNWHIVIDDASHQWKDQKDCFLTIFPSICEGGIYIIEDIHTSFGVDLRKKHNLANENQTEDTFSCMLDLSMFVASSGNFLLRDLRTNWARNAINQIGGMIRSVTFINHACIIVKKNASNTYLGCK
ncbi:class I SAM-dependent methyltransferase [Synechococcus sp. N26]|uniref:class I SAM-dependent methyltransferase n=1 Tax=Synechococcus sp. N26 TaxID=2575513 RepID=UPI0010BD410B|nr:class I SAM-dependent methyltransferase [Synechococcus sp. N26]